MIITDDKLMLSGKVIGEVIGNTFHKVVDKKKHYMRMFDAYGIQEEVFDSLLEEYPNVNKVVIVEKGGKSYYSQLSDWLNVGFVREFGYGKQRFLPIKHCLDNNQLTLMD